MGYHIKIKVAEKIAEEREVEQRFFEKQYHDSIARQDYQAYLDACEGLGITPEFEHGFAPREKDEDISLEMITLSAPVERKEGKRRREFNERDQHRVGYLVELVRDFQHLGISFEDKFGDPEVAREFLIKYYGPQTRLRGSTKPLIYEDNVVRLRRVARDRFCYLTEAVEVMDL